MTGALGKFHIERGIYGARIMARSHLLTGECRVDEEIRTAIEMLKDDLDACACEMKRIVAVEPHASVVEPLRKAEARAEGGFAARTASQRTRN